MPRQYLSTTDVIDTSVYQALSAQIVALPTGQLDAMLFRASQRCDNFTKRRLQAPPATTVGVGGAFVGGTSLPLSSTLGIDKKDEQAVQIGVGLSTQETIVLTGGMVVTTPLTPPYPGSVTLASPLQHTHNAGETVQVVYQEVSVTGSSSGADLFEDVVTQQAQIAAAHAGGYSTLEGDRTRHHWLWQFPLITILDMQHAYPYTNQYGEVDVPSLLLEPVRSHIKFPVGTFILQGGLLKTTYSAGYQSIPDDIVLATSYYLAAELQALFNASGALEVQMGKRRQKFSDGKSKSLWVQQAEDALAEYVR